MTSGTPYHHGDLPNALRSAAVDVIGERGLGAFSLREVARRAGVSHTAPAHHFGDIRGLLTSVAIEGFDALHAALTAAGDGVDDPVERLIALGDAYVTVSRTHHAHCDVMFRVDVIDPDDERLQLAGMRAYGVLEDTVRSLIDDEGLDADVDDATWLCWSAMQGLVSLGPKIDLIAGLTGRSDPSSSRLVREFGRTIVGGLRAR